jgi:hypothetical protein
MKKDCEYDKPGKEAKVGGIGETIAMIQERGLLLNLNPSTSQRKEECVNISWGGCLGFGKSGRVGQVGSNEGECHIT